MLILGFAQHTVLRVFNIFILYWGVHRAIVTTKHTKEKFKFLEGYKVGLQTGAFVTLLFSLAIIIFHLFNSSFTDQILLNGQIENAGTIFQVVGVIAIEAIGSTFICTYASMQWLKEPRLKQQKIR
jgi:hypothetical protein